MADVNSPEFWSDAKQVDVKDPTYWQDAQVLDAPHNSVFDQDRDRVVEIPQTCNAAESEFLIKRDADQVKDFFGMEDVGAFTALGRGAGGFFQAMPQVLGGELKAYGESIQNDNYVVPPKARETQEAVRGGIDKVFNLFGVSDASNRFQKVLDTTIFNDKAAVEKGEAMIERNKKHMADAGWTREGLEGVNGVMYDIGAGGSSMLASLGFVALTRAPSTAGLFFGAMQHSSIYQEARAAGKTPEEAQAIALPAGVMEGALEFVGLDRFVKALKGNSFVKRFVNGFAIEAIQESSQAGAEESITQGAGLRSDKTLMQTAEDILYQGFLGGLIGGGTNATVGAFVQGEAEARGLPKPVAAKMRRYAEENVDAAKGNLTEFIDKELAPIAADNKSAQEFMTLMQKFGNDQSLVERDSLDPETRAVFDQYTEMFNNSKMDTRGVQDVEKMFFDQAVKAGVSEEEATGAAKLVGARADAASRALGVSPMEWYKGKNIQFGGGEKSGDEVAAADADLAEAKSIKESLMQKRSIRNFNKNDPAQVQRKLGLPAKPMSVLQFIRSKGGISLGMTPEELHNVKAARKSKGRSASKASMASQEIVHLFDGKKGKLSSLLSEKGLGLDELQQLLEEAGYIDRATDADQHQEVDKSDEVLDLIGREAQGDKIYPVNVELSLAEQRDTTAQNFDYLASIGIDESMTPEEIAAVLRERRAGQQEFVDTFGVDDEILFQKAPKTSSKAFKKWFGKSKVVDEDGKPIVVYHGTTHDFTAFDKERANIENDFGAGFYFSNTEDDVNENYAGEGADLTARISMLAERIASDTDREYDDPDVVAEARKQLHGGTQKVIEVYLSLQNPVIIGGKGETFFEMESNYDEENDEYGEPTGTLVELAEAFRDVAADFHDVDADKIVDRLFEEGDGLEASLLIRKLKTEEGLIYATDENGTLASSEIIRAAFEKAGYDGIIDRTVNDKFGSGRNMGKQMAGMHEETIHYIAFRSEQVKSVENKGKFDANNADILNQEARGSVTFGKDKTVISLFEGANASTLLHELGHIFLRDMQAVASVTKRPRVKADYEAVKKWLGAKGDTLTVAQEEKFARGFEAYLREGKAPKPELQSAFDAFKKWLEKIYKSVQQLNVNINPAIRETFDRMLGGDFAQAETLNQEATARSIEEEYAIAAAMQPEGTFLKDTGSVFRSVHDWSGNAFVPISTRLGNIDQKLKHAVRKFVFNIGLYTHEDHQKVKPFIEKVSDTFSEEDYRIFDLALKNRDQVKAEFLADKYGIQEEWRAVREVLDGLYIEARDVGLNINYIEEYFPRKVKRGMALEYMAAMRGHEQWSEIEAALKEADPDNDFTAEEQAAFVNSFLRGFSSNRINLSRPSFTKERTVDHITPEFNKYYEDSMPTLIEYIGALRNSIEARRLFGKAASDRDTNIGNYVLSLVRDGVIAADQEAELKEILKAVVEPNGTHGFVGWLKNSTYIYTMGSPISAITQIQDLAFSLHKNGYFRTVLALTKSLTGNQILKKEDIGIDNILQEFETDTRAARFVRMTFKAVGLTFMDNVGKETYIEASYRRLKAAAEKGGAAFDAQMQIIFGDQANTVKTDLIAGRMTEDVKYLLFSELSDVQPISLAEMPVHYLNQGNWRVMYMLKTYTMKQIDIYRREIFSEVASGDPKRMANGMKNLIGLAAALMMMGMSSDALKDLLLGRDIDLSDLVIDNLLKLLGISKFQIYKSKEEGIGNAIFRFLTPPVLAPLDDLRDVGKIVKGKKKAKDADVLQRVPLIGKFYYWWVGGGTKKKDKDKSKVLKL